MLSGVFEAAAMHVIVSGGLFAVEAVTAVPIYQAYSAASYAVGGAAVEGISLAASTL